MPTARRTLSISAVTRSKQFTLLGCLLFKYDAIDTKTMESFQSRGISTYEQAAETLQAQGDVTFRTAKALWKVENDDKIVDVRLLLITDANSSLESFNVADPAVASKTIVLDDRMDDVDWNEIEFNQLKNSKYASVIIIPISASRGHNILEPSSKCMWYEGWERNGLSGKTLLDALDSFA